MANPEHVAKLKSGVAAWNSWRRQHPKLAIDLSAAEFAHADLRGADLRLVDLSRASLRSANLANADLTSARLIEADLRPSWQSAASPFERSARTILNGARLRTANLFGANLAGVVAQNAIFELALMPGVDLTDSDLSGADLTEAILTGSAVIGTNLTGARLHGAKISWATFGNVDLRATEGLDTVQQSGPSTVGLDTFFRSKGLIPERFLRGCGVPEQFISYARSLIAKPVELYSCFISYSTADQTFADRFHSDLQAAGVRCWFAPHDMQPGKKIYCQIDEAIRVYDKLLLILSPASIASGWVKEEILNAWAREQREKRQMLFPIALARFDEIRAWKCFDAASGRDVAKEIREYFIPDFSTWKTDHDAYKRAFDRVVASLGEKASVGDAAS